VCKLYAAWTQWISNQISTDIHCGKLDGYFWTLSYSFRVKRSINSILYLDRKKCLILIWTDSKKTYWISGSFYSQFEVTVGEIVAKFFRVSLRSQERNTTILSLCGQSTLFKIMNRLLNYWTRTRTNNLCRLQWILRRLAARVRNS